MMYNIDKTDFVDGKICAETLVDANTNDVLTFEEFSRHVQYYASEVCPEEIDSYAGYVKDDGTLIKIFSQFKCDLCIGYFDLYHTNYENSCDCKSDAGNNLDPIYLSSLTEDEATLYCHVVSEAALIQCAQPSLMCLEDCYNERNDCYDNCGLYQDSLPSSINCLEDCYTPFYLCVAVC